MLLPLILALILVLSIGSVLIYFVLLRKSSDSDPVKCIEVPELAKEYGKKLVLSDTLIGMKFNNKDVGTFDINSCLVNVKYASSIELEPYIYKDCWTIRNPKFPTKVLLFNTNRKYFFWAEEDTLNEDGGNGARSYLALLYNNTASLKYYALAVLFPQVITIEGKFGTQTCTKLRINTDVLENELNNVRDWQLVVYDKN